MNPLKNTTHQNDMLEQLPPFTPYEDPRSYGLMVHDSILHAWLASGHQPNELLHFQSKLLQAATYGHSALVNLSPAINHAHFPGLIYVKQYKDRRLSRLIKSSLGYTKARHVWDMAWKFIKLGIPVPLPLGFFISGIGRKFGINWYCCEAISNSCNLAEIALFDPLGFARLNKSDFWLRFADAITIIHQNRLTHNDLKWPNILIDKDTGNFWFIDLDASKYHDRGELNHLAATDLGRLLAGAVEVGQAVEIMIPFIQQYAAKMNIDRSALIRTLEPVYQKHLVRKNLNFKENRLHWVAE